MIKLEGLQSLYLRQFLSYSSISFCKWKLGVRFNFLLYLLGSLDFNFNKKTSSSFGESEIEINFQAKTKQKMSYPPDFEGLSRAAGKIFRHETNFRCYIIAKLKFWVYLKPTIINTLINTSVEKLIRRLGRHIWPLPM